MKSWVALHFCSLPIYEEQKSRNNIVQLYWTLTSHVCLKITFDGFNHIKSPFWVHWHHTKHIHYCLTKCFYSKCHVIHYNIPFQEHTQKIYSEIGPEGSQMLFYVWFEFTSWLRGVGQGKGAWDCFLTIWAWDNCAFCQWDQWLLRDWTFILQMTLSWPDVDSLGLLPSALMFCLNLKKSLLQSWL